MLPSPTVQSTLTCGLPACPSCTSVAFPPPSISIGAASAGASSTGSGSGSAISPPPPHAPASITASTGTMRKKYGLRTVIALELLSSRRE